MGSQISKLCKYFSKRKDSKIYQQQPSGTLSLCKSRTLVKHNSDGYDSQSEHIEHHLRQCPIIQWKKGELIGQGSFGRVYKCMDIKTGKILAVKQIELAYVDKESLKSFHEEINILSQLQHKNIVEYYGCEENDQHLSILLEFVGGGSIAKMIKQFKSKFSESVIQTYVKDILQGLVYLHNKGVIHRDIKGANIIVDPKGVCKLADFGCSIFGQEAYSLKGTPNWMAPEVINQQETRRQSDIWSLGCTILEMLTGEPPWGFFQSPMQALLTISSKNCSPPYPDNISQNLKDFLDKCLQFDYTKRWKAKKLLKHPFITNLSNSNIKNSKKYSKTDKQIQSLLIRDLHVAPQIDEYKKDEEDLDRQQSQNILIISRQSSLLSGRGNIPI